MTPFAPVACPAGATNCYLARSPDSEALQLSRDGTVFVRLSSRGDNLPCTGGFQVQELDSFIAPSTNEHYPGYPSAWHPVNLAAISSLHLAATVTPVGYVVPRERPCGHATLAYVLLAAVFNNPSAHQTFFYQLIVGQAESGNILRGSYFYDEKNPFGFDDLLSSYGLYPHGIPEGSATSLRVDLLPKIAALITSGRHGIDPILSHWETSHLYVGHLIFGNLAATTEWSNVSLVAGGLGRP
jgi:hypothetical protein